MRISVFVTTEKKFAEGDFDNGQWLSINHFRSLSDFEAECKAIHSDESDPQFLFLDNDAPRYVERMKLISRDHVSPGLFSFVRKHASA